MAAPQDDRAYIGMTGTAGAGTAAGANGGGYSLPTVVDPIAPSGGGGGGGGGSYSSFSSSSANDQQIRELFGGWMGRMPTAAEMTMIRRDNWGELTYIWRAVNYGGKGPLLQQAYDRVRQIAAPFYGGDPSALPQSLLETLTEQGLFADETYLRDTYFPALRGADLTNPLSAPYIDAWVEMTGRPMTTAAIGQLDQYVRAYGYSTEAQLAFEQWAKGTNDAITGNYGAAKRAQISGIISTLFGREATADELASPRDSASSMWDLSDQNLVEKLRTTPEYRQIYSGKPADMSEQDWIANARAMDAVMRWYYGDNVIANADGSLTIGGSGELPYVGGVVGPNGEIITPGGTMQQGTASNVGGLSSFGVKYVNPGMLSTLTAQGYTPEQIQKMFQDQEQVAQNAAVYDEILTEAFGEGFTSQQWSSFVSGGAGSGELKAKLVEAQNRVGYRETYRLVFGTDPDPADYERIMGEFVSPEELLREYQAQYSADEMYDEVNDLLMRVYGESVSREELKDMALKRAGSGELSALINQATKLNEYREYHKQYYGQEATPDDYARYAGYVSPAELQWDIVATETAAENKETIKEAWTVAFPDEPMVTDEDIYNMYAGREGYGEMKYKVGEAEEALRKKEQGRDWAYVGAERGGVNYTAAEGGGFKQSVQGLDEL